MYCRKGYAVKKYLKTRFGDQRLTADLSAPVSRLKGVGGVRGAALEKLGVRTLGDLLRYYPRDYEDRRDKRNIGDLSHNMTAVVKAAVVSVIEDGLRFPPVHGKKRPPLRLLVRDDTGVMEILFFGAPYLSRVFAQGETYIFYGNVIHGARMLQMIHPDFSRADEGGGRDILPIYPLSAGLSQRDMRKWTEMLLPSTRLIEENLPAGTIAANRLCGIGYALDNIHYPADAQRLREAKYRLVFEELLILQTGLLTLKRASGREGCGIAFKRAAEGADTEDFVAALPFELTGAQRRTLDEIQRDMESTRVMNRLIQGDVGSGKTVIAAAAMYKAVKSGYQAVIMAPTETLARQHMEEFERLFAGQNVRMGFLTGAVRGDERRDLLEKTEKNEIDILIGTHALIQPDVVYGKLGLVVTDEQHRFGVKQRVGLSKKGADPDILVMTATPIPRTLAFILYGDLDVSVMDERPPGRKPVVTRVTDAGGRDAAYRFIMKELRAGRQAYVVAPLIDDSDETALRSATGLYDELSEFFCDFTVALVHGRMRQTEKDAAMDAFYSGAANVLVSTVLIEVGVNVPNATVMLIENAERFGLAQLHQLRGRVGRGSARSYCILITEGGRDGVGGAAVAVVGEHKPTLAAERARIMLSTDDGFVIAEKDLELRGPGEFFGVRQHGIPPLRIANLAKHVKALSAVKAEAERILADDPLLCKPENAALNVAVGRFFASAADVGI
ncbi:MAG: ATP-dependent DNA helicase RecG [Clostridiales Family XIII bacterium]|jgi:ATP-dependent DNA helicase RecG|nr:ATP-dependent DNA helicase RecG [Clostridiales Family XIII bacterium]